MDILSIFLAKYFFVISLLLVGTYFLRQPHVKKKLMVIFAIPSAVLTWLIGAIGSHFYFDPRPFVVGHFTPLVYHIPDNGFPSDHVLMLSFLAMLVTFWNKKLGITLWIITIIIAIARVYVGVHHPIDVIGSMIISCLSVGAVYLLFKHVLHKEII